MNKILYLKSMKVSGICVIFIFLYACSSIKIGETERMSSIVALVEQSKEIEMYIAREDKANPEISKWSMYRQCEHVLLVNTQVLEMIAKGDTPLEKRSRSLLSYLTLTFGFIPRGRADAPDYVLPKNIGRDELFALLNKLRNQLIDIEKLKELRSKDVVGNHPYFGGLNRIEWLRFIEVHTKHHLKIIREILSER